MDANVSSYTKSNPDLKWEEKHETNFGIDFSMLNNRISGNIDYYVRKVNDLLLIMLFPVHQTYTLQLANVGKMENRGIEIMINFTPFDKKNLVGRPALVSPQIKINSKSFKRSLPSIY